MLRAVSRLFLALGLAAVPALPVTASVINFVVDEPDLLIATVTSNFGAVEASPENFEHLPLTNTGEPGFFVLVDEVSFSGGLGGSGPAQRGLELSLFGATLPDRFGSSAVIGENSTRTRRRLSTSEGTFVNSVSGTPIDFLAYNLLVTLPAGGTTLFGDGVLNGTICMSAPGELNRGVRRASCNSALRAALSEQPPQPIPLPATSLLALSGLLALVLMGRRRRSAV